MSKIYTLSNGVKTASLVAMAWCGMMSAEAYAQTATPTLVSTVPADGATLSGITDSIKVVLSDMAAVGYMEYRIDDAGTSEFVYSSYMHKDESNAFFWSLPYGTITFYEGHDYTISYKCFTSEEDTHTASPVPLCVLTTTVHGNVEKPVASEVTLLSVSPESETTITRADRIFTLTFSAPVNVDQEYTFINYGQGVTFPFASITSSDDKTVWSLEVSESYMATAQNAIAYSVVAYDEQGRRLAGNSGGEVETAYYSFVNFLPGETVDYTVTPETLSTVDSLYQFTLTCSKPMDRSWTGEATIRPFPFGDAINITKVEPVIPEGKNIYDYIPTTYVFTLDSAIYAAGTYMLSIPEGYFMLDPEQGTFFSEAVYAKYFIVDPIDDSYAVTPAPGTYESLKDFSLTFASEAGIQWGSGMNITLTAADGTEIASFIDEAVTMQPEADWTCHTATFSLATALTTPGTYTLSVPEGFFLLGSDGTAVNPFAAFDYTIAAAPAAGTSYALAAGSTVEANDVVALEGIKMTYGDDTWTVKDNNKTFGEHTYYAYASGAKDPKYSATDKVAPTAGSYVIFEPEKDGTLDVAIVLNASKSTFCTEDGEALPSITYYPDGAATEIEAGGTIAAKYYGLVSFDVKAGKTYHLFCTGSKMGYYGFIYTAKGGTVGIQNVTVYDAVGNGAIYNLKGCKVTDLKSGELYIRDGKKFMLK